MLALTVWRQKVNIGVTFQTRDTVQVRYEILEGSRNQIQVDIGFVSANVLRTLPMIVCTKIGWSPPSNFLKVSRVKPVKRKPDLRENQTVRSLQSLKQAEFQLSLQI